MAKAGLTGLTKVAFVGATDNAEICITNGVAILADETYDIDVSFEKLKLRKLNPQWTNDYGHCTNYFTTWLRNTGAAENTVTYTDCTFPNGVCNNQYGKTVFDNCQFINATEGLYNLWVYGGNVELNGGKFSGTRGAKVYTEGTPETVPAVTIKDTSFDGLTEKAAIVVSKAATVTLTDVSANNCSVDLFQKDIEKSGETTTITANGEKISGEFNITAEKGTATAKNEFNISAGTFTSEVPNDYCADGFEVKANADGTTYGVVEAATAAAQIGETTYETLAEAFAAAKDGDTITLLRDATEDVTIDKNITLDLGGKTLTNTNAGKATISVSNGATATVKNGSVVGGTSYYNIEVTKGSNANLTLEGVTATAGNNGSSMIDNWGTLTITSGTYSGGLNVVKSEEGSKLTITGGKFTLEDATSGYTGVVFAYGDTTISGGEFIQKLTTTGRWNHPTVILTGVVEGYTAITRVTGGHFVNNMSGEGIFRGVGKGTSDNFEVSGGTFNKSISESYCADGFIPTKNADGTYGVKEGQYVAEVGSKKYETLAEAIAAAKSGATVKLLANTKENVTIDKGLTLDLNGFTLNGSTGERKPALTITARVTVKDSSEGQTGTIMREDTAENSGVSSHYVIDIQGNAWVMFESGNVKNGSGAGGTKGASLVRVGDDSVAKYPGLNIKGGTFTQDNFIVIKVDSGDLFLNGGTLSSKNSYAIENWHRATIKGGTVNGTVAAWTYSGGHNSDLTISGGTINGNIESVSYDGAAGKKASVSITGGVVNGMLSTHIYNKETEPSKDIATIEVTGGTFSSDPTKYLVECSTVTPNADGTFGVAKAYLAKVGNTSYYTMDEAFKAQTASGAPIVMLRDYTTGSTFNSGTVARVVDLGGYTWTCTGTDANSAAFEINNPNATLTVKNGKIVSSQLVGLIPSAMGGTIKYDNSSLTFENVEMSTTATSGIETNGSNTNDSVKLVNSTLNVPNGFGIYFPSSGTLTIDNSVINAKTMGVQVCAGSLSINAGSAITVTGDAVPKTENDGAIQDGAAISIVNRTGYKDLGKIKVTGGTFTAKTGNAAIKAYDWKDNTESAFTANDKINVSGGTFSSAVPEGLCADGFIPTENTDGTYGVKEGKYVAKVGSKKYETLADAIGAAQDGDTVTLLKDIDLPATAVVKRKTITLDLNGKTISNSTDIWNESINAWSLISVRDNGDLTINDTAGGGTLKAKENDCYALDVQDKDTALTVNAGTYVGNISAIYAYDGKVTINGGHFSIQQKKDDGDPYRFTLNCYDSNYKADSAGFTVNGGTFENFDPRNNPAEGAGTSFVAESVGVDKNTDGTFTAKPNMAAQIVDAGGGSVAAYAGHYDAIAAAKDGETVILLSDRKNFVTNTINANITIDLNGKTLSVGNNNPFFCTNGEVTIQNGTIESNYACAIVNAYNKLTLKNVKITGVTGDSGKNLVNVCSNAEVTIDKDTVLTASGSGVAVFIGQNADAKYTLNVYGKVIRESKSFAISGNGSYKGTTTINIYDGAEVRSASVAIYHPQAGVINVNGGLVEGYCAIGIKSGSLNIKGGTVRGTANDHILDDSDSISGTIRYDGSAIVVDSRTDYKGDVKINISGDALVQSSYSTAIREIGESAETTNVTALNVTGGKVLGASGKAAIQLHGVTADVTSISGGTYSTRPEDSWVVNGYRAIENTDGTYTVKEANIAIQVTSRIKDDGVTTVSTTTGGGMYCEGEEVTVTTSNVVGFKFLGWYEKDSYMTQRSADLSYTFTASKNCTLVALYSPAENATLTVKVTASAFKINGSKWVQNNGGMYKLPVGSSVTVTYTDDTYTFLYWVNGSDKIVSTSPEYTFTLGSNTELRACTSPKNTGNDNAMVVFKTAYDQVLTAKRYGNDEEIVFPMGPSKTGYKFIGWSMTQAGIRAAMAENDYIVVTPEYETLGTKYTVTVKYEGIEKAEDTHTINVGDSILLTAETEVDGKTFSCWKIGDEVVSYLTTLTVFESKNVIVTAVYGVEANAEAKIRISDVSATQDGLYYLVTFTQAFALPEDATLVLTGFIRADDEESAANMNINRYSKIYKSSLTGNDGTYYQTIASKNADKTYYMMAFVQYKDAKGNLQTVYSECVRASYASLKGGN